MKNQFHDKRKFNKTRQTLHTLRITLYFDHFYKMKQNTNFAPLCNQSLPREFISCQNRTRCWTSDQADDLSPPIWHEIYQTMIPKGGKNKQLKTPANYPAYIQRRCGLTFWRFGKDQQTF